MTQPAPQQAARRVLVVDDHPVVRHGIMLVINAEPDLTVCGEAENEQGARRLLRELQPDALVVDLSLGAGGDGFNIVRDVHAHFPQVPILVLSMHDETVYADRLFAQGASGYIMKQAAGGQLVTALRTVLRGERFMSEELKRHLAERVKGAGSQGDGLSPRELQVISLIGLGFGTREIAERLSLSVKTVETHRLAIKRKLTLDTNAQLVQYAIKWHGPQPV
ncbi:MAG TPA: response regulator transcription factor [Steroidobacteraceae bacterium]|nr:response regulator transcription factor [Steroidobacteraceae bacterium]